MCDGGIIEYALAAAAMASTAATVISERSQAQANQKTIDAQAQTRSDEVAHAAAQQESEAAAAARQARSTSIVAAGESGINLGSGSFVASLQTTTQTQYTNEGLIMENEKNQQQGLDETVQSELNSKATAPTVFGGAFDVALSGAGAYMKADQINNPSGAPAAPKVTSTSPGYDAGNYGYDDYGDGGALA